MLVTGIDEENEESSHSISLLSARQRNSLCASTSKFCFSECMFDIGNCREHHWGHDRVTRLGTEHPFISLIVTVNRVSKNSYGMAIDPISDFSAVVLFLSLRTTNSEHLERPRLLIKWLSIAHATHRTLTWHRENDFPSSECYLCDEWHLQCLATLLRTTWNRRGASQPFTYTRTSPESRTR